MTFKWNFHDKNYNDNSNERLTTNKQNDKVAWRGVVRRKALV